MLNLLYLAALFHDIGKVGVLRKSQTGFSSHAIFSDEYLGTNLKGYKKCPELRYLIVTHHGIKKEVKRYLTMESVAVCDKHLEEIAQILHQADGLASSLTRWEGKEVGGQKVNTVYHSVPSPIETKISSLWVCLDDRQIKSNRFEDVFRAYGRHQHTGQPISLPSPPGEGIAQYLKAPSLYAPIWARIREWVQSVTEESFENTAKPSNNSRRGTGQHQINGINLAGGQDVSLWTHVSLTAALAVCLWHAKLAGRGRDLAVVCYAYPHIEEIFSVPAEGALKQITGRVALLEKQRDEFIRCVQERFNLPEDVAFLRWQGGVFLIVPSCFENGIREVFGEIARSASNMPRFLWPRSCLVPIKFGQKITFDGKTCDVLMLGPAISEAWKAVQDGKGEGTVPSLVPRLVQAGKCRFCGRPSQVNECSFCREVQANAVGDASFVVQEGSREISWPYAAGVVRLDGVRKLFERGFRDDILPARVMEVFRESLSLLAGFGRGLAKDKTGIRVIVCKPYEALVLIPADVLEEAYNNVCLRLEREKWLLPEDVGLLAWFRVTGEKYPVRDTFQMVTEDSLSILPSDALFVLNGCPVYKDMLALAKKLKKEYREEDLGYAAAFVSVLPPVSFKARRSMCHAAGRVSSRRAKILRKLCGALCDSLTKRSLLKWSGKDFVVAALLELKAWASLKS